LDAGQGADALVACEEANVRLHLTFGFESETGTPLRGGRDVLKMWTNSNSLIESYFFDPAVVDEAYTATVDLPYPQGTVAGPATVSFYAIDGATGNWEGSADFVADPATCIEVALFVSYIPLCCGDEADAGAP
jgi:hypothetical protein